MPSQSRLQFRFVLTPDGWVRGKAVVFDRTGRISALEDAGGPWDGTVAVPGLPNAHSHVFQRALAGRGEARRGEDSFWSWREAMYALAGRVDADGLYAIACQAYAEMLASGFTSVAEFHYLHHATDGTRGPEQAEAVIAAAKDTGIRLRLLPVLYQRGGFGLPPQAAQARFVHERTEDFLQLLETLKGSAPGVAFHSLRAVVPEMLPGTLGVVRAVLGADIPVHIHIAEQQREVDDCIAATGATPISLLLDSVDVDRHWSLVHATHPAAGELEALNARGAAVVVCPLTEAYLGDGLFPGHAYLSGGGVVAVGSDSNARIDAVEELRWLEYGQRLNDRARARLSDGNGLAAALWRRACRGGAAALGLPVGGIAPGAMADLVVLEPNEAPFLGQMPERWLDALVVAGSGANIHSVYVGGRRLVDNGEWARRREMASRYDAVVKKMMEP